MENEREPEVIRQQMSQTRGNLTNKVEAVERMVVNTVKSTTEAVTDTVEDVKEAVTETVEGVKHVFDLKSHIRNHPWLMTAGAIGAGYLAGRLFRSAERSASAAGATIGAVTGAVSSFTHESAKPGRGEIQTAPAPAKDGGLLAKFADALGPPAVKLREIGIGYSMSLLDQLIAKALPENLTAGVHEIVDSLTRYLGGRPISEFATSGANGSRH